jgi:hypothetical protein
MALRASNCLAMIVAVASIALVPAICRAQQGKPSIDDILEIWKKRQDKVASARFELDCEQTIHKGVNSFFMDLDRGKTGSADELEPSPPRDYLVKGTSSVSLDGGKLRHSSDHQNWDPRGRKLYAEHYVDVFDGHLFKDLQDPASGQDSHASAVIRTCNRSESAGKFDILPLIFTFRGSHPQFFQDLPKFQLTGQTITVAGHPCLEFVRDRGPPGQREFLYVDRIRDYVVVKEMIVFEGQPNWQLDVKYAPDDAVGWIPKSWQYVIRFGKEHRIIHSGRRTLVRYEINPPMDDREFDIAFPPGTLVHNESSGDYLLSVVRDNGESGTEIPLSRNPTYEDLQKASPGMNRWTLITVSAVILALALAAWLLFRRWRIARHTNKLVKPPKSLGEHIC